MPFEQPRQRSTHGRHVFVSEVGTVRDALDVADGLHLVDDLDRGLLVTPSSSASSVTREEAFIVPSGAMTARFARHEETAGAGDALIIPADPEFSLVAQDVPAEAICVLPVGGQAVTAGGAFIPPWAK